MFTFFGPEIEEFLLNNAVDIPEELATLGLRVETQSRSDPTRPDTKDAVTVLLASAAATATLLPAITRILEGLLHRPIKVTELTPVAVTDDQGKPVRNASGEEKLIWVERTQVIPPRMDRAQTKVSVNFLGFKFEYASNPTE